MPKAVPLDHVERLIFVLRGHRVLLDDALAELYGVPVKVLNQAVKRNSERFPADFMFQLTLEEAQRLRSQIVTLNAQTHESTNKLRAGLPRGQHLKYLPHAFTDQGVAMLSGVLSSPRAVQVNIEIMRDFVRLRQMLQQNTELARKVAVLEHKYDAQFKVVFDAIRELMTPPVKAKRPIGFNE
ncbi:MAG TPA: ORF6N domain-containing protein [Polyangiaceae bacterium]|nr:ORF6N domain-containing protein [Polyangiaceae bacterium]